MKPIDVTPDSDAEYNEDSNEKDCKFRVGDHARISKYKNIFPKGYTQNWPEEVFVVSNIKDTVPWTYAISDFFKKKYCKKLVRKNSEKKK